MATHRTSLASHTLRREEGSCNAAIIELSSRQKLDVTNQICALHRSHPLSLSSNTSRVQQMAASYYLTTNHYVDNYIPLQQLGCVTRPFIYAKGVACETTPWSPPEFLDFSDSSTCTENKGAHYGKHASVTSSFVWNEHLLFTFTEFTWQCIVTIGWSSLLGITCVMATLTTAVFLASFHSRVQTQGVWHGASQRGFRDWVKSTGRSRASLQN